MSNLALEAAAEATLGRYRPKLLRTPGYLDIIELLDEFESGPEAVVFGTRSLEPGLEGFTDPLRREIIVDYETVYLPALDGDGHARQTCAHEAGHIQHITQVRAMISHFSVPQLNRAINIRVETYRNPEWQAHRFGQALLMPRESVKQVHGRGGIQAVEECFGVSRANANSRLRALRLQGAIP